MLALTRTATSTATPIPPSTLWWVTATGKTRWQVACDLLYGQVKKTYRRPLRELYLVGRLMRLGELAQLTQRLKALGYSGTLNTAFVERLNLTVRHALAALSRRSWATVHLTGELHTHLEWWRAYYHFCRPHLSLRLELDVPQLRRGKQTARRAQRASRTPATPALHPAQRRCKCDSWSHGSHLVRGGIVGVPCGSVT